MAQARARRTDFRRMGVKVRGSMYCEACNRPVAGQKGTHRFRNVAATVALPVTMGASARAYAAGQWHCPHCGGPVKDVAFEELQWQNQEDLKRFWRWCTSPVGLVLLVV